MWSKPIDIIFIESMEHCMTSLKLYQLCLQICIYYTWITLTLIVEQTTIYYEICRSSYNKKQVIRYIPQTNDL